MARACARTIPGTLQGAGRAANWRTRVLAFGVFARVPDFWVTDGDENGREQLCRGQAALPRGAFWPGFGSLGRDGGADLVFFGAEAGQRLDDGRVAVAEEGEQEVLGADVVIAVRHRLVEDGVPLLLGLRGVGCPSRRDLRRALAGDVLGLLACCLPADPVSSAPMARLSGWPARPTDALQAAGLASPPGFLPERMTELRAGPVKSSSPVAGVRMPAGLSGDPRVMTKGPPREPCRCRMAATG